MMREEIKQEVEAKIKKLKKHFESVEMLNKNKYKVVTRSGEKAIAEIDRMHFLTLIRNGKRDPIGTI